MLTLRQAHQLERQSSFMGRWKMPDNIPKPQGLIQLNRVLLYLVVPLLGVIIPNSMGLISHSLYSPIELVVSYMYFILISFLVWKGNVSCLMNIRRKFMQSHWNYGPTVAFYFLVNVVYTGILTSLMLFGWTYYSPEPEIAVNTILITSLVVIVCVVFINNVYELFYLHAEKASSDKKAAASDTARIRAELQVLKGQFDPHFLYNSLNVLNYLISQDPSEAEAYNAKLGKLMQYPLRQKRNDWVLLVEELEFTADFFALQQIRYGANIRLHTRFADEELIHNSMVPPMSLQLLVENAIKHNSFSEGHPLNIYIIIDRKQVKVVNNKKPKPRSMGSAGGIGLMNLQRRIRLLSGKKVEIRNADQQFCVTLPLQPAA